MPVVSKDTLTVRSGAFDHKEFIPMKYAFEGVNINPPLEVTDFPKETKSLALIMEDPDAPGGTYDHWIMWNIEPKDRIEENSAPGVVGMNSKGDNSYYGPNPPAGNPHHYQFIIYALDSKLDLPRHAGKKELLKAIEGHKLASGELVGLYQRRNSNK